MVRLFVLFMMAEEFNRQENLLWGWVAHFWSLSSVAPIWPSRNPKYPSEKMPADLQISEWLKILLLIVLHPITSRNVKTVSPSCSSMQRQEGFLLLTGFVVVDQDKLRVMSAAVVSGGYSPPVGTSKVPNGVEILSQGLQELGGHPRPVLEGISAPRFHTA